MPHKKEEETRRVHLHLSVADIDRLDMLFGANSSRPVGRSKAVAKIIRHYLNQIEAEASKNNKALKEIHDIEI